MYIIQKIMKCCLRIPTTQEIWSALSKVFYNSSNELQVFYLNQKTFIIKQNGISLSKYYREQIKKFRELDHRDQVVMKDPNDIISYKKFVERLRIYIPFDGLNEEFEQVHREILQKKTFPDLERCYSQIRQGTICQVKVKTENPNISAMTTQNQQVQNQQDQKKLISYLTNVPIDIKRNIAKIDTSRLKDTQIDEIIIERKYPNKDVLSLLLQ